MEQALEAQPEKRKHVTSVTSPSPIRSKWLCLYQEAKAFLDEFEIKLWRDRVAWCSEWFPRDTQKKGRKRERKHVLDIDSFEDTYLDDTIAAKIMTYTAVVHRDFYLI